MKVTLMSFVFVLTFGLTLQRRCLGDGAQCLHGLVGEVPSL